MVRARKPGPGRGGARQGAPGQSYANRSDLTQAPRAVPGQTYGVAGAQLAAQQAIPLPGPGAGAPTPSPAPGGLTPTGSPGGPMPPPIDAPTQRPGEPLTNGIASGPGAGPEVLRPPDPLTKAAAVLNLLGASADPATRALRERVNAMLHNQGAA